MLVVGLIMMRQCAKHAIALVVVVCLLSPGLGLLRGLRGLRGLPGSSGRGAGSRCCNPFESPRLEAAAVNVNVNVPRFRLPYALSHWRQSDSEAPRSHYQYQCCDSNYGICIKPDIKTVSDVVTSNAGISHYLDIAAQWRDLASVELRNLTCTNTRSALLTPTTVIVYWNATFVPYTVRALAAIGDLLPGCRTSYFNLLDRESQTVSFSWQALLRFFSQAVFTGELRLPIAVILGSSEYAFERLLDDADGLNGTIDPSDASHNPSWELKSFTQRINLVASLRSGRLKNRRLATDLLEFLDSQRPSRIGLNAWNDLLVEKIPVTSVPGMKQFDIDGLDGEDQSRLLSASNQVLGYFTAAVLVLGLCFGLVVMQNVFAYRHIDIDSIVF